MGSEELEAGFDLKIVVFFLLHEMKYVSGLRDFFCRSRPFYIKHTFGQILTDFGFTGKGVLQPRMGTMLGVEKYGRI